MIGPKFQRRHLTTACRIYSKQGPVRKNVGARHLERQTLFFLEKTGDLFSHHRPSVSCQFSRKTGDLFLVVTVAFIHFTRPRWCRPLFSACMRKICRSFCGAPFCGAPVRPNMPNMPKSAADSSNGYIGFVLLTL